MSSRQALNAGVAACVPSSSTRRAGDYTPPTLRYPSRQMKPRASGGSVAKSKSKSKKKHFTKQILLEEIENLQLWAGWESEDEANDYNKVLGHSDRRLEAYSQPTKKDFILAKSWLDLPGEVRNAIYDFIMANEETRIVNISHYPQGLPRRSARGKASSTNFSHSSWGLTQTCLSIREEFLPLLMNVRRVRTPLATLNKYVEVFHPPNENNDRKGSVEPICGGTHLPQEGVDILKFLRYNDADDNFTLELEPTSISPVIDFFRPAIGFADYDEVKIMRDLAEQLPNWSGTVLEEAGITGIYLASTAQEGADSRMSDEDDEATHELLIDLITNDHMAKRITSKQMLARLSRFIFASRLDVKEGLKLQASFAGGHASWVVQADNNVDMEWHAGAGMSKILHLLVRDINAPNTFQGYRIR